MIFSPPLFHTDICLLTGLEGMRRLGARDGESPMLGHMPCVGGHGYVW